MYVVSVVFANEVYHGSWAMDWIVSPLYCGLLCGDMALVKRTRIKHRTEPTQWFQLWHSFLILNAGCFRLDGQSN